MAGQELAPGLPGAGRWPKAVALTGEWSPRRGDSEGGPFAWLGLGLRIYASARLEVLALLPSGCALVLTPLNAVVFASGLAELQAVGGPAGRAERGCGYPAGDVPHHWWELNGETGQARGHLPRR